MSERLPDSIEVIRADKFVETDANAFVVLSKEESDRIVEKARLAKEARKAKRLSQKGGSETTLHFPVFILRRGKDEFPLVKVNEEMTDCLPVFTSGELAELYLAQAGSDIDLHRIGDRDELSHFLREMASNHGVKYYAFNFTFEATSVNCAPISDLLGG